jgi:hypothetical protein
VNSRQRFLETLLGRYPDHPPLFPEGIREEVLQAWHSQGLPTSGQLDDLFYYDKFEELAPDIYPIPEITDWSDPKTVLSQLRWRLNADDPRRIAENWNQQISQWRAREHALILRIHQGIFLCLGIDGWNRFEEVIQLLVDEPEYVREILAIQAGFASRLAENILREVEVDAVLFSEPIASSHGPLISPRMYRNIVLDSYTPILDVLERFHVPVVIWRSYANTRPLIPEVVHSRFNAIWACEAPPGVMNYDELRREVDPAIGLIGGIDSDVLRQEPSDIHTAVESVLSLIRQGRYIPLADGRVREDVPFQNYTYYRKLLEKLINP